MNKNECLYLATAVVLFWLAGCAVQKHIAPSRTVCLEAITKAQVMAAAEDALTGMQCVIEKYDTHSGLIRTKPLRGSQFFEFWRLDDNVGSRSAAEANLHSIQRTVSLSVFEKGRQVCMKCDVAVRRLSVPEKEISGMSQMAGMFTAGSASLLKLKLDAADAAWIDLGSEPALEDKILELIENKIVKLAGSR